MTEPKTIAESLMRSRPAYRFCQRRAALAPEAATCCVIAEPGVRLPGNEIIPAGFRLYGDWLGRNAVADGAGDIGMIIARRP
ncbi:hypothetical protein ATCCBAA256_24010 [Mycobacterium montefiorense]|nr:hypothetical protein ATCCBAA256_24010 [Mycobacterium montefiorense]